MKNLVIAVLLATLLAACATPKPVAKGEESSPAPVTEGKRTEPTAPTVSSPEAVASVDQDPLNDRNSMLAKRSLYYPLDGYVVQDDDKPAVPCCITAGLGFRERPPRYGRSTLMPVRSIWRALSSVASNRPCCNKIL